MTTQHELYDQTMSCIERYAEIVAKYPDNSEMLTKLQDEMAHYCSAQLKHKALEEALNDSMNQVEAVKTKIEADELYKAYEQKIIDIGKRKTRAHDRLKKFNAQYFKKRVSEGDEDLLITQNTISTIDPISKVRMVDPVKNKNCGHHYEKSVVLQMIKRNPSMRCPFIGCTVTVIKAKDLVPDDELKRYLANYVEEPKDTSSISLDDSQEN